MEDVCAIRAHIQEPCSNDQTLQILSAAFASEGNCRKNRRALFLPVSSLIFEMSISDGWIRQKTVVLIFWYHTYCMVFFFRKIFFALALRKILGYR